MNKEKLERCEALCRGFLQRVDELNARVEYLRQQSWIGEEFKSFDYLSTGLRESGALKRVSMELTRALAELRRPG